MVFDPSWAVFSLLFCRNYFNCKEKLKTLERKLTDIENIRRKFTEDITFVSCNCLKSYSNVNTECNSFPNQLRKLTLIVILCVCRFRRIALSLIHKTKQGKAYEARILLKKCQITSGHHLLISLSLGYIRQC